MAKREALTGIGVERVNFCLVWWRQSDASEMLATVKRSYFYDCPVGHTVVTQFGQRCV